MDELNAVKITQEQGPRYNLLHLHVSQGFKKKKKHPRVKWETTETSIGCPEEEKNNIFHGKYTLTKAHNMLSY